MINMNYVQLSLDEYDRLKEVQVEATTLVEQTNANLKQKLDIANSKIAELEADLRRYAIGGARMKPEMEEVPEEDCTEANEAIESFILEEDKPSQTSGKAKLSRRRWEYAERVYMRDVAGKNTALLEASIALNRTVSSIKTQAARMGLSSSNGILSLEK